MSSSGGSESDKEGKVLRKQPLTSETTDSRSSIEDIPFRRPTINPDVEGILKGELVELLESDRTKLLTSEQEKILSRKDISVRQKERQLHDEIEARKSVELELLRKAEEDKVVLIQEEKNSIILERIAQRQEQRRILRKEREERKAKEAMEAYVLRNSNQQGWYGDEDLGEVSPGRREELILQQQQQQLQLQNQQKQRQQQQRRRQQQKNRSKKGKQSPYGGGGSPYGGQRSPYGGQVEPITELPGEYADGVWSDAEDYGYSKQFPYPKKDMIINEDTDVTDEYPVDNPYEDIEHLLVGGDDGGSSSSKSSDRKSPISTGRLEGLEKGLTYIDKAAANLQVLLGRMADYDTYSGRTPVNSAIKKKKGKGKKVTMTLEMVVQELDAGESEYDLFQTDVGTEVKALTLPGDVNPNMVDKSTQVRTRDILMEYKALLQSMSRKAIDEEIERKQREELEAQAALEEYIFRLERKESERRDAMTLTRPLGYKELDLKGASGDSTAAYDIQTQVSDKMMDDEYALKKGLVLSNDDILWPSCGSFDIEYAVKRIQDYIKQCWTIDPKWMFDIKPVQTISDDYRKRYVFEAKFSIPTKLNPVPQATASVFFIMEISHYAPKEDIVQVHYVVEGNRFIHTPGTLPFQDRWLWSVVTDKTRIQRAINF